MERIESLSTKYDPNWLYITAALLILVTFIAAFCENQGAEKSKDNIHWVSLEQAAIEAKKDHKPILYMFTARWCGPCKRMEQEAFRNQKVAELINKTYIPVMVIDESEEMGKNPPAIEKLQKDCAIEAFPTLIVVPPELIGASTKDIYSTGNINEYKMLVSDLWSEPYRPDDGSDDDDRDNYDYLDWYHDRVPEHRGYDGVADLEHYFFRCKLWHRLPPSKGNIAWQPLAEIDKPTTAPKLIAFVEDSGAMSDLMRIKLLENSKSDAFIERSFTPFLVEVKRHQSLNDLSPQLKKIADRFQIKSFPALVVVTDGEQPSVQDGFSTNKHAMQFLKRAIHQLND